jgi:4-amino-4-deoxy-L-arabinose transferase-like glycosyltransferase
MTDLLVPSTAPASEATPPTPPRPATARTEPWARWALLALLTTTALLYLWGLGASGWANSFYSAAVQAGTESWKAAFFGSSDAANLITVDKAPLSLWPMILSARLFGVSSWSILVPQALMGVASVGVLHATVKRWHGAVAGLIAGSVLALTPVAALMFRFNNPDAMLVLLLTMAAYAMVRALEAGSRRWLLAVGALIGLAFLAKSLQAFLVVPGFAGLYLLAAPVRLRRRVVDLLLAGVAMVAAGGWWVAIVELWPASSRPYIGGSQSNSALELIFGYNGFGRLTGDETGSVVPGGGTAGTGQWGPTGLARLFNESFGGQASWLLPAALVLLAALVALAGRRPRTDRLRGSALLWGGWLVTTGLTISLSKGIIHEYYTVALVPAIGALVGIGVVELWRRRHHWAASAALGLTSLVTVIWSAVLLGRSPAWQSWLRPTVLVMGLAATLAVGMLWLLPRRVALAAVVVAGVVGLAGSTAYALDTVATAHDGSLPTAGPSTGGRSGMLGGGPGGGPPGGRTTPPPGATGAAPGARPGTQDGTTGSTGTGGATGTAGSTTQTGGLLSASEPGAELVALLEGDADSYTWVAAASGSNTASGYQLATGSPVMSLGGFNGSDPWPTLDAFRQYVAAGEVHFYISGGGLGGGGAQMGGSSATAEIAQWVQETFTATTVDGVTVYDLTSPS